MKIQNAIYLLITIFVLYRQNKSGWNDMLDASNHLQFYSDTYFGESFFSFRTQMHINIQMIGYANSSHFVLWHKIKAIWSGASLSLLITSLSWSPYCLSLPYRGLAVPLASQSRWLTVSRCPTNGHPISENFLHLIHRHKFKNKKMQYLA